MGKIFLSNHFMKKIFIVIPAFNEEKVIAQVIQDIQAAGFPQIIVVDDGSSDQTYEKIACLKNVVALRHFINRGKGAAVKTGIEAAKKLEAEIVITMDGDGQHDPQDAQKMLGYLEQDYDVILGSRLKSPKGMPKFKIIANHLGNFFVWLIYGLWVTDSQSGFRAYGPKALKLIQTKTDRYEYDSEVIREIKRNKLKYLEIPIRVIYTDYSQGKIQKQGFKNGIKTLIKMFLSE